VVLWLAGKQKRLNLLIKLRKGITRKLFKLSKTNKELRSEDDLNEYINTYSLKLYLALISGLYSLSVSVGDYKTVVIIASRFGIALQLLYLRQLIEGYRCICMVWVTETEGMTLTSVFTFWLMQINIGVEEIIAIKLLLNLALAEDALEDSYVRISSIEA
jgi:hypothetical protein